MKMRFMPDEPITDAGDDILGFADFVSLLHKSLANTTSPFVYGVLGDWGTGKTSILKILQNKLEAELQSGTDPLVPIWFNAWQYENESDLIYPILHAIKNDHAHRFKKSENIKKFGDKFKNVVVTSMVAFSDLGLRMATKQLFGQTMKVSDIANQLQLAEDNSNQLEMILGEWADQVAKMHGAFEMLLDVYAEELIERSGSNIHDKDKVRFVIIIDDLDRCLPETTIAILENIKNYLAVKNCIFIIGLNQKIVYQGIRVKYSGLEINGQEYLEKILNYSFYIPEVKSSNIAKLTTECFKKLVIDTEDYNKFESYFTEFGKILEKCNFYNPRKIKRILNRYLFFIAKNEAEINRYHNSNIVRFIVLAEYFPNLFKLFLRDQETFNSVKAALACVGTNSFSVQDFEDRFSININVLYPQLSKMSNLFELNISTTHRELEPVKQAQEIFGITRYD